MDSASRDLFNFKDEERVNVSSTSTLPAAIDSKLEIPWLQQQSDSPAALLSTIAEYDLYLQEPRANRDIDPLIWWRTNGVRYPKLAKVAQASLAIPSTSAASERVFSRARLAMPWNRCRLAGPTLRAIMCLRNWFNLDLGDMVELDSEDYQDSIITLAN